MIEFGELQADLPTFQNSGAIKVDNVLPLAKGYKSLPGFQALSGTGLTASAVGLFSSFQKDGVTNYAGDSGKLYQMNSSLVFVDKSKAQVVIIIAQHLVQEIFGTLHSLEQI